MDDCTALLWVDVTFVLCELDIIGSTWTFELNQIVFVVLKSKYLLSSFSSFVSPCLWSVQLYSTCTWWVIVSGPVWRLQEESGPLLTTALQTEIHRHTHSHFPSLYILHLNLSITDDRKYSKISNSWIESKVINYSIRPKISNIRTALIFTQVVQGSQAK